MHAVATTAPTAYQLLAGSVTGGLKSGSALGLQDKTPRHCGSRAPTRTALMAAAARAAHLLVDG